MWPSSVPSGLSAAQPRPLTSSPSSEPCHENSTPGRPSRSASRQSSSPVATMKPEAYTVGIDDEHSLIGAVTLAGDQGHLDASSAEDRLRPFFPQVQVREIVSHDWNSDP
jgi:hypothetical protein